MTAFNVVRFRVKPGSEQQFIEEHRRLKPAFKGFVSGALVRTGDQTFCMIGQWRNFRSVVDARPAMIGILDRLRDMLEDLGGGLGATDPVSGEAVVEFGPPRAAKKRPAARPGKARRGKAKRAAKAGKRRKG